MKKKKVIIIGPYPPPIGGISVHIARLSRYLRECGFKYTVIDESKEIKNFVIPNYEQVNNLRVWIGKSIFSCKNSIIHYHSRNWYDMFLFCLVSKIHRLKLIVTLHSFREEPSKFNLFKKLSFKYCIRNVTHFIAVGENEKDKLVRYKCDINKISVIPAFIVPRYDIKDDKLIPNLVWNYMKGNDINISANAFKISFYNKEDLYGIDMCINLCYRLKKEYKNKKIGFVFCLPEIGDHNYFEKVKKEIKKKNIENSFLFVNERIPLYPVLRKSDIFIRPTNTDSYGVSIAEAIYYDIPSIASDVCDRPQGTILFKSRDQEDLEEKVIDVINNYEQYKAKVEEVQIKDYAEDVLEAYKCVL
ncbi:glycosyltransferase [Crassaminicella profunda]|uniref:glycosyltransferase n=1 Tax=Crassaminicella profunda TaxID=1286698 RepID=UPI001CA5FA62|nr:glycosyltransferase [Crassaminicella profunda]QZY55332.1 glycosyltransferase [Crassaminicella profunda]